MITKRPAGRNGAVRFFSGTEDNKSNIAQEKYLLKIPTGILDIRILNLSYNTK